MRFTEIRTLTEEQLDELKMSPSSLRAFVDSPAAEGIQAGFEAELIFRGLGETSYDEMEPDYDMDERTRGHSIDSIIEFFEYDDWGYGISRREANNLRNELDEKYMEWFDEQMYSEFRDNAEEYIRDYIVNNDWDEEEKVKEHIEQLGLDTEMEELVMALADMTGNERKTAVEDDDKYKEAYELYQEAVSNANDELESWVEQSYRDEDGYWDSALDQFRDDFQPSNDENWLEEVGYRYMSDISSDFDITWPYITGGGGEGGYNEDNAEMLADDLNSKLGVQTKVSSGYHSATRKPGLWIFEPDSSLDPSDSDDMPVEIISPPMPLKEALAKMKAFFEWAASHDAYSNDSTGFHMGISLPHRGGEVDFVKLALFLGDEHVLQDFGRASNHFCEAAMKKIRNRIRGGNADVAGALTLMQHNLLELASRSIQKGGFGKYTSINPNNKYIEFRSAGGHDDSGQSYFEDIDKIQNTMMRYAQAMAVAGDPSAERKEYYKKLYKLIAPSTGDVGLDLFARFTAGTISKEELKKQWAEAILNKDAPELAKKSTWVLYDKVAGKTVVGQQYSNYSYSDALQKAKAAVSPGSTEEGFRKQYDLIDTDTNTGRWSIVDKETGETLEVVDAATRGAAADLVYDKYTKNGAGFFVRPYVEFDKEPPKLSRRAELAKRIKQGPKGQQRTPHGVPEWELYDVSTNNVINSMVAHNVEDAWQQAEDWLRSIGAEDRSTYKQRFAIRPMIAGGNQQSQGERHNYEFYSHEDPSTLIDHMTNATADEVRARIAQHERNGMPPGFLRVRQV